MPCLTKYVLAVLLPFQIAHEFCPIIRMGTLSAVDDLFVKVPGIGVSSVSDGTIFSRALPWVEIWLHIVLCIEIMLFLVAFSILPSQLLQEGWYTWRRFVHSHHSSAGSLFPEWMVA